MATRFLAALAAGALALGAVAHAEPPQPVEAEVLVVLAAHEAGTFDPALEGMPALRKTPFDAFKSMKLLSRVPVKLAEEKPVTVDLPNGRQLQLVLLERMSDGRHRVQVSINRPQQKYYLPLLQVMASGEPFFVAGQKYEGKTLVIGVRVGPRAKK